MGRLGVVFRGALVVYLVSLCMGCGLPSPSPPPGEDRATTVPTATPTPSTAFRTLTIRAADDVQLTGNYYPPQQVPAPGVLLLHQVDGQKEDWAQFASQLQETGFAVLALDLRGHGESGGEKDWAAMPEDAVRAWSALTMQEGVDPERTAIGGASVGANLALVAAANQPRVQAILLLSPGLEYRGIETGQAMVAYGDRAVFISASEGDAHAAESARELADLAQGSPVVILYPGDAHGIELLAAQPDLCALIVSWLVQQLRL